MFENVLIGVDGRQGGRDAIALARQLASPRARLTLVNVYGAGLMAGRGAALLLAGECRLSEALLAEAREAAGIDADLDCCADHSIGRALRGRAAILGADLIVVGSSAHKLIGRCTFGDDTAAVLSGAHCAVAIAPRDHATTAGRIRRIAVADEGESGVQPASTLALARRLAARLGPGVEVERLLTTPARALEAATGEVELLVLGTSEPGRLGRLLHGNPAEQLVRDCRCPVLVLPAAAWRAELTAASAREANPAEQAAPRHPSAGEHSAQCLSEPILGGIS